MALVNAVLNVEVASRPMPAVSTAGSTRADQPTVGGDPPFQGPAEPPQARRRSPPPFDISARRHPDFLASPAHRPNCCKFQQHRASSRLPSRTFRLLPATY